MKDKTRDKNEVISLFVNLPLWFIVTQDEFCIWNRDTATLNIYEYNEIHVIGKRTRSSTYVHSFEQPIDEIDLELSDGTTYTINFSQDRNFDHFYLSLLGQLAVH